MSEQEIYQEALDHYGLSSQHDKLIEEMSELTKAILKHRRKPSMDTLKDIHDEFADVQIVMEQIKLTLDVQTLQFYKLNKLTRLQNRIAKGEKDEHKYQS